MKDFNFDNMKNYNVSDEWADKVLDTVSTIKPRSISYGRIITACSCLIFVCIISVFVLNYSKTVENSAPEYLSDETVSHTEPETEFVSTQQNTEATKSTEKPYSDTQTVTDNKPANTPVIIPTEISTTPQVQPSTQAPTVISPTEPMEEPTQQPTDPKEDTTEDEGKNGDCIVSFSPSYLVGSGNIYCRIKTMDNVSVGDSNLTSDEHLASFYSGFGSKYYYIYSPRSVGLELPSGTYRYYFYNEHSVPICSVEVQIE